MRIASRRFLPILLLLATMGGMANACANNTPPNLSPQATLAYKNTQVIKGLNLLRDTAISANAQVPPLISEATTRKIVLYHQSAVKTIDSLQSGWKSTVSVGLDEVTRNLPSNERQLLTPYISLVKTVLAEIQ